MRHLLLIFIVIGLIIAFPRKAISEPSDRVEIAIEQVLLPAQGYDDNDHVQAVVYGELPHACFTLGETVAVPEENGAWRVRQFAWLRTTGACAGGDVSDQAVPYTAEVSLGRVKPGSYRLKHTTENGREELRAFSVAAALSNRIDEIEYAAVTNAFVPAMVFTDEALKVSITGTVNSNCERVSSKVEAKIEGDVIVLLPAKGYHSGVPCEGRRRPFRRDLNLGKLARGQYLLHVRSQDGKAINRVFSVVDP